MDGSVIEEKTSFKMLRLTFSPKLDWGSYITSNAKTASKKIGPLIRSLKFPYPEVALYLYKSTVQPSMEYCCHVGSDTPSCYFELLDMLQKHMQDCYKDVYVNSFFPCTARLWNSLPMKCFPLTFDLSGFKSRLNRYFLTQGSFSRDFLYALTFLCFFFL